MTYVHKFIQISSKLNLQTSQSPFFWKTMRNLIVLTKMMVLKTFCQICPKKRLVMLTMTSTNSSMPMKLRGECIDDRPFKISKKQRREQNWDWQEMMREMQREIKMKRWSKMLQLKLKSKRRSKRRLRRKSKRELLKKGENDWDLKKNKNRKISQQRKEKHWETKSFCNFSMNEDLRFRLAVFNHW